MQMEGDEERRRLDALLGVEYSSLRKNIEENMNKGEFTPKIELVKDTPNEIKIESPSINKESEEVTKQSVVKEKKADIPVLEIKEKEREVKKVDSDDEDELTKLQKRDMEKIEKDLLDKELSSPKGGIASPHDPSTENLRAQVVATTTNLPAPPSGAPRGIMWGNVYKMRGAKKTTGRKRNSAVMDKLMDFWQLRWFSLDDANRIAIYGVLNGNKFVKKGSIDLRGAALVEVPVFQKKRCNKN